MSHPAHEAQLPQPGFIEQALATGRTSRGLDELPVGVIPDRAQRDATALRKL